jgi:hypothetical protein
MRISTSRAFCVLRFAVAIFEVVVIKEKGSFHASTVASDDPAPAYLSRRDHLPN